MQTHSTRRFGHTVWYAVERLPTHASIAYIYTYTYFIVRTSLVMCKALWQRTRAFVRIYRALLRIYRALLRIYRARLRIYRAPLRRCRAFVRIYRALLCIYRALLRIYRALWYVTHGAAFGGRAAKRGLGVAPQHVTHYARIACVCVFEHCHVYSIYMYIYVCLCASYIYTYIWIYMSVY